MKREFSEKKQGTGDGLTPFFLSQRIKSKEDKRLDYLFRRIRKSVFRPSPVPCS